MYGYRNAINELMKEADRFVGISIRNELLVIQMYLSGETKEILFDMDILDLMALSFYNARNTHCYDLTKYLELEVKTKIYVQKTKEREQKNRVSA